MTKSEKLRRRQWRRQARRQRVWLVAVLAALAITVLSDAAGRRFGGNPAVSPAAAQARPLGGSRREPPPQLTAEQARATLGARWREMAGRRRAHVSRRREEQRTLALDRRAALRGDQPLERNPPPPPRVDDVDLAAHPGE